MDRRDKSESTDRNTEDRFQKALKVIIDSYKGIPPEDLYREAIDCFDSLIDISRNTDAIIEFSHRNGIDLKYLVDGANFVTSKMLLNPENNFYLTLGLSESSTQEEIRERWKRLMLLYHPDLQQGKEDWVSERAKKVNEAYTILKDETKRMAYNLTLRERNRPRQPVHTPQSTMNLNLRRQPHGISKETRSFLGEWAGAGKYLPRILIGLYIMIAGIVLWFIYQQNIPAPLEKELTTGTAARPAQSSALTTQEVKEEKTEGKDRNTIKKVSMDSETKQKRQAITDVPLKVSQSQSLPYVQPDSTKTSPDIKKSEINKDEKKTSIFSGLFSSVTRAVTTAAQETRETAKSKPSEPTPRETLQKKESETQATEEKSQKNHSFSAAEKPQFEKLPIQTQTLAPHIPREEVEDFIRRYGAAYEKGDLDLFMTFFSTNATENNFTYHDMREAYRKTFSERISYYRFQNAEIKIEDNHAYVTGIYNFNRYQTREEQWVKYSGRIKWKLTKEKNILKIVSVQHDN